MKIRISLIFLQLSLLWLTACAQSTTTDFKSQSGSNQSVQFNIMFYNVENLFDTENDETTLDDEFTPEGKVPWTPERFQEKLKKIAEVINAINKPTDPDIIGLSEIENEEVLERLVQVESIEDINYKIIHYESRDERGIDVALLYNPATFKVVESKPVRVNLPDGDKTRDILYVKGTTNSGNTLHLFVNHWPSRREGTEISEAKRAAAARVLRAEIDRLFKADAKSNIVIMGDFNDEPADKSMSSELQALAPENKVKSKQLYNMMFPLYKKGEGSLFYKDWDLFDQIIVSGNLLDGRKIDCNEDPAHIFNPSWLMYNDKGVQKPSRTMGSKYYGGYSDHLPVYLELHEKK